MSTKTAAPPKVKQPHHPHAALKELDSHTAFFYAPRTVTCLIVGVGLLGYYAGVLPSSVPGGSDAQASSSWNAERGVWAAILAFLGYSIVQGPSTAMVRPHPAVWRLVHGVLVLYVVFLVWMLFQTVDDARLFLKHLHPALGVSLPFRSYGDNCDLYIPGKGWNWGALKGTLLDEFVVAHAVGWWAKALIIRNHTLLWILSIGFELMERTFKHMLPNFNECWWDSWLLDVSICNFAGIMAGMWTVRFFECKYEQYNWQGLSELPTMRQKAVRSLQQFLPYSWDRFTWMTFSSPKRFLQSMFVVLLVLGFELNVFFLKYALWIPPTNPLNTARLLLWFLAALPGTREWWLYCEGQASGPRETKMLKLGPFAWLCTAMVLLETMCSVKFGRGLYTAAWPRQVVLMWLVGLASLLAWLTAWQAVLVLRRRKREAGELPGALAAAASGGTGGNAAADVTMESAPKGGKEL